MSEEVGFTDLPDDILFLIAGCLDREDILQLRVTCKKVASVNLREKIGVSVVTYEDDFENDCLQICMRKNFIREPIVESTSVNMTTMRKLCRNVDIMVLHWSTVEPEDLGRFKGSTLILHKCYIPKRFRFSGEILIMQDCIFARRSDRILDFETNIDIEFTQEATFIMYAPFTMQFEAVTVRITGELNVASVIIESEVFEVNVNASIVVTNANYIDGSAHDLYFDHSTCIHLNAGNFVNFNTLGQPEEIADLCYMMERSFNIGHIGGAFY